MPSLALARPAGDLAAWWQRFGSLVYDSDELHGLRVATNGWAIVGVSRELVQGRRGPDRMPDPVFGALEDYVAMCEAADDPLDIAALRAVMGAAMPCPTCGHAAPPEKLRYSVQIAGGLFHCRNLLTCLPGNARTARMVVIEEGRGHMLCVRGADWIAAIMSLPVTDAVDVIYEGRP